MSSVISWIRRRYHMGLTGFPEWIDMHPRIRRLFHLWNHRFGAGEWIAFRAALSQIAEKRSAILRIDDWRTAKAEWIAPVDDDDWHLPSLCEALANVPPDFVMACWSVNVANLTAHPNIYVEPISWQLGPHSCGYAVRRSFLEGLTPRQLALIRDDHRNVHRYVDFSGNKYFLLEGVFGQYVWTPASISSITETADKLNLADPAAYAAILPHCPPGVAETVKLLIGLVIREGSFPHAATTRSA